MLCVEIRTVELTDQSVAPLVKLVTHTGEFVPIVAFSVNVIVPVDPGEPVPVVIVIVPAWSVEPVSSAQDGLDPPPVENAHVGALPTVSTWELADVPLIPIVGWFTTGVAIVGVVSNTNLPVPVAPVEVTPSTVWCPVKVFAASVRAMVALVVGKVIVVESVPSSVIDLLNVRVLPATPVSV